MNYLYISGALTGIPNAESVKNFYEAIGLLCQDLNFKVYVPHLNTDPIRNPDLTPSYVFKTDKTKVIHADLVIAYLGYPSVGVGMELAYAEERAIPIILLYEKDRQISRFPRGIPTVIAEIQFNDYKDALNQLQQFLEQNDDFSKLKTRLSSTV
jgi:nucleoside 2-deoxyribosyltransferase